MHRPPQMSQQDAIAISAPEHSLKYWEGNLDEQEARLRSSLQPQLDCPYAVKVECTALHDPTESTQRTYQTVTGARAVPIWD